MTARDASPRLGRGLAALLGEGAQAPQGGKVHTLAVTALEPSGFQPRSGITAGSLDELVDSIRARGILQPLLARPKQRDPGRYEIVAGERRWRAAQLAGLHELPVLIRELTDIEAMAGGLVENLQRTDLDAIEEAEGYRRLIDEFKMTQEELAVAVGKSRSHIANTLRLLNLPSPVKDDLRRGALSAGHARALLAHPDPIRGADEVKARGLNVRQTEALASTQLPPPSGSGESTRPSKDPNTMALEQELSAQLGLRVSVTFDGRRGHMRIAFGDLDQLDGLVRLLRT